MSTLEAVVLGIVQGLTEFLPISSSAHLRVVPELVGWNDPGAAFSAVVQLGTMAAVLVYFWADLWRVATTWLRSLRESSLRSSLDARLGWYLIVATVPISVLGLVFDDAIETAARDLRVIAGALIGLAVVLAVAERVGRRRRHLDSLTTRDGVAIGTAQALALVPGSSRSGVTITAGLFLGYDRESAARFSFLLSVPAVVLSGLYQLSAIGEGGGPGVVATILATVAAFVVGYASIAWLLRWLVRHSTMIFVYYRIALGTLVFALLVAGTLTPR